MIRLSKNRWKIGVGVGVGVIIIIIGLIAVAFRYPERVLTIDSGDVNGDVIVVLGGMPYRSLYAAKLYHKSVAPLVLVTGSGDASVNVRILLQSGVPADAIIEENKATSTYQNAIYSIPILRRIGAHRVIIVTSWYHSRRALACFQQLAPDMVILSRPYLAQDNSINKMDSDNSSGEYLKIIYYWVCYGIAPFTD